MLLKQLLWVLILLTTSLQGWAIKYAAPMASAEWNLELSPFECRMWQPIPVYGDAVFQYRAGEKQKFFLAPTRKTMKTGKALLVSSPPVWDETRPSQQLGYVPVNDSNRPVQLKATQANQLLTELDKGMTPVFTRQSWYSDTERVHVGLSSINFRKSYQEYRKCLATLLPVNFDQIAKSRLRFASARWELTPDSIKRLDTIVHYVKADPSVTGFFVDGHTDDMGRRLANLDLSKKRAEAVTKYLVAKGIDESLITTRYHGERYPIVKNKDAKSRRLNRRVTIRLERTEL
ncbi:OmpA family protein [Dasania sp. GY-MA-18]|uniref:OmpA family protein n=1 Tax=Dasania phycosphaerae TaxID=2950436 RepID=A0A9J6RIE2_9GAMM|nr:MULTISPECIES: OmpA family protein [Dasania]MCR8921604.1 OmpA family protein [Dasania sp. GY-MA-18]MCZ0864032.1 OmpA family protein [Dasania phycosphaerae]MCZ0867760.1 OmpA family protein [Dasania phycosphaerae]